MKANQYIARSLDTIDSMSLSGIDTPLLIMSHPGFGKTSTLHLYCEYKDYNLYPLISSQYSAEDILGLQTLQDNKLVKLAPHWFDELIELSKNQKRTLLFLDEITCVDEWIQGPLLDLIFSRKLGPYMLPSNVLVIAAGNYSEDLNNTFHLTSSLINRFLILNLQNEDYDIESYLKDPFEYLKTKEEIKNYLNLNEEKTHYDFDLFKKWLLESGEISFDQPTLSATPSAYENKGILLGNTSLRSLSYSLKFANYYTSKYGKDNLWIRIIGDTLGVSNVREGKLLRNVILGCSGSFVKGSLFDSTSISSLCDRITEGEPSQEDIETLAMILEDTPSENLTPLEIKKLNTLVRVSFSYPQLQDISSLIIKKQIKKTL